MDANDPLYPRLFTAGPVNNVDSINRNDACYPGQPSGTLGGHNYGYSIGWDWAISPRLFNEIRLGFKVYTAEFRRPARLEGPMLHSNSWTDPLNPAFSLFQRPPVSQITDNFTVVEGRHTFKAGAEGRFTKERTSDETGIWPNDRYATELENAQPPDYGPHGSTIIKDSDRKAFEKLYNDLVGRMSSVIQTFYSDLKTFQTAGTPRERTFRYRDFSAFFQDDWKIDPHLAVNLGLRYELFGVPSEIDGKQGAADKAALIDAGHRIANLTMQPGGQFCGRDFNNLAPRIGIAWDPSSDGKTAVRANWGIFYDRLIGATTSLVDANTPGFTVKDTPVYPNLGGTDIRVSDGIPLPHPPANPQLQPPAIGSTNLALFSPNLRTGYVQHYSLTVQREVFRNTIIEAGYVGTHGVKMFMDLNLNQPRIYEDFLAAFRELQSFPGTPVPDSNTLVRIFVTPEAAVSALGRTTLDRGEAGVAADSMDRTYYAKYAPAGISEFYLRNYPQFDQAIVGTNDGRSYYNSFQLSLRRQGGALKSSPTTHFQKQWTTSRPKDSDSSARWTTSTCA